MERTSILQKLGTGNPPPVMIKLKLKDFESLQQKLFNEFKRSNELIQKSKNENALDKQIEERLIVLLTHIKTHSGGNQRFFNMIEKMKKNIGWKEAEPISTGELDDSQLLNTGSDDAKIEIKAH